VSQELNSAAQAYFHPGAIFDKKMARLLQPRKEDNDEVINKINQLMERWEQRITRRNLKIAERFVNFELQILLHVRVVDSRELWVVCLEVVREETDVPKPVSNQEAVIGVGEKRSVLVDVIKLVDFPKRVIPAFVWFESVDSFYRFGTHTLYFSSLLPFVSSSILRNRKLNTPTRLFARPNPDELVCKVIKRAPEVVDNIASRSEGVEGTDAVFTKLFEGLARLRIFIGSERLEVLLPETNELGFEVDEVLLGPLNFHSDEDQSVVGRHQRP